MSSDDAIIRLYPLPLPAEYEQRQVVSRLLDYRENSTFARQSANNAFDNASEGDTAPTLPGETPPPSSELDDTEDEKPCFELGWENERKNMIGFVMGTATSFCDIVIPFPTTVFKGVSAVHGLITFDDQKRLVYKDLRDPNRPGSGSSVTYDGKGGELRRGFTWILSGTDYLDHIVSEIVIQMHPLLKFRVSIPAVDRTSVEYQDKVTEFWFNVKQSDASGLPLGGLSFSNNDYTALPTGAQTVASGPIEIQCDNDLGMGGFGVVKRFYNVSLGTYFARKTPIGELNDRQKEYWHSEIRLLKRIKQESNGTLERQDFSRFIVHMFQGETAPSPFIDFEYAAEGSLLKQNKKMRLSMREALAVQDQALKALTFLHGLTPPICHRDIKPANMLVQYRRRLYRDQDPRYSAGGSESIIHIKLADLGIAKDETPTTYKIGTYWYKAPELYRKFTHPGDGSSYTTAVDIWALGVTVYELAHGFTRASGDLCEHVLEAVLQGQTASPLAQFVAHHMVRWDPWQRLSARECLNKAAIDLFAGGWNAELSQRGTLQPSMPAMPVEHTIVPAKSTVVPAQPNVVPEQPTVVPADQAAVPAEHALSPACQVGLPTPITPVPPQLPDGSVQPVPAGLSAPMASGPASAPAAFPDAVEERGRSLAPSAAISAGASSFSLSLSPSPLPSSPGRRERSTSKRPQDENAVTSPPRRRRLSPSVGASSRRDASSMSRGSQSVVSVPSSTSSVEVVERAEGTGEEGAGQRASPNMSKYGPEVVPISSSSASDPDEESDAPTADVDDSQGEGEAQNAGVDDGNPEAYYYEERARWLVEGKWPSNGNIPSWMNYDNHVHDAGNGEPTVRWGAASDFRSEFSDPVARPGSSGYPEWDDM